MRSRFLLIHNPLAGRRGNRLKKGVVEGLKSHGAQITSIEESDMATVVARISKIGPMAQFDAVIVSGGDGTVRAVVSSLWQQQIPLGLIPSGTGNVLAHEIGQPFCKNRLVEVLLHGPEIAFQASQINGKPFLLMAGIGFDAEVIARLNLATKQRLGKLAYAWPIFRTLLDKPEEFDCEIDGTKHKATWLIATRSSHYAGSFIIAKSANLKKPGMTAVVFTASTRLGRMQELFAIASSKITQQKSIKMVACHNISVFSTKPRAIQADGDESGITPAKISTGHSTVHLIVPPIEKQNCFKLGRTEPKYVIKQ